MAQSEISITQKSTIAELQSLIGKDVYGSRSGDRKLTGLELFKDIVPLQLVSVIVRKDKILVDVKNPGSSIGTMWRTLFENCFMSKDDALQYHIEKIQNELEAFTSEMNRKIVELKEECK